MSCKHAESCWPLSIISDLQEFIWRKHLRSRCLIEVQQITGLISAPGAETGCHSEVQALKLSGSVAQQIGDSRGGRIYSVMKFLDAKVAIGGPGLVASLQPKSGISVQKAWDVPVWTRVQSPPAPQNPHSHSFIKRRVAICVKRGLLICLKKDVVLNEARRRIVEA